MHALDSVCFDLPFRFSRASMRRFAEAKKAQVLLAHDGDVLAGFCILHQERLARKRVGYIVTLDVAPAYRRKGLGSALMQAIERQARAEGCVALALHVFTGNDVAMQFYERYGFAASHRVEAFYGSGRAAWVFHKPLLG